MPSLVLVLSLVWVNNRSWLVWATSVLSVSPDALSQRVSSFWISVQTIHKVRYGKVKVLCGDPVLRVHNALHKLHPFALVDPQHHVVVQELPLLHEDLRVVRYHVSIDHRGKGRVVLGRGDVLLHQLTVAPALEAGHQLGAVLHPTAHFLAQLPGILTGLVVDSPTG